MTTPERHTEETKMMVPKSDVEISKDGHLTIKNPRVVEKLRGMDVGKVKPGAEAAWGVGVVISF